MVARPFEKLKAQAAEAKRAGDVVRCCIPFCPNRSMLSAGVGFDAYYCEYHRAKIARHGHAEYPSIKGKDLRPYTETAQRWIKTELKAGNVRRWRVDGNHRPCPLSRRDQALERRAEGQCLLCAIA
jgi:hypothetical protein